MVPKTGHASHWVTDYEFDYSASCVLTHNKLYYPYAWLADPSRWVITAVLSVFSWISNK